jgi:hypothetical protein
MYKIQNTCGGSLSLRLEKNCIILPRGSYYDLDGICSRAWIHTDITLKNLIKNKHVRVVHDSESHIAKQALSSNAKVFNLLKPKDRTPAHLPNNTYRPQAPNPVELVRPQVLLPHNRSNGGPFNLKQQEMLNSLPSRQNDEPLIVDLAKYVQAAIPVSTPAPVIEEPVIEALPVIKVNEEDLAELFKEFPELKQTKKRGRKKRVKVAEVVDGSNQPS